MVADGLAPRKRVSIECFWPKPAGHASMTCGRSEKLPDCHDRRLSPRSGPWYPGASRVICTVRITTPRTTATAPGRVNTRKLQHTRYSRSLRTVAMPFSHGHNGQSYSTAASDRISAAAVLVPPQRFNSAALKAIAGMNC